MKAIAPDFVSATGEASSSPARHLIVCNWSGTLLQQDQIFWPLFRYLSLASEAGHGVIVASARSTLWKPEVQRERITTLLELSKQGQLVRPRIDFAFKDEVRDVAARLGFSRAFVVLEQSAREMAGAARYIDAIFVDEICTQVLPCHMPLYAEILGFQDRYTAVFGASPAGACLQARQP